MGPKLHVDFGHDLRTYGARCRPPTHAVPSMYFRMDGWMDVFGCLVKIKYHSRLQTLDTSEMCLRTCRREEQLCRTKQNKTKRTTEEEQHQCSRQLRLRTYSQSKFMTKITRHNMPNQCTTRHRLHQ